MKELAELEKSLNNFVEPEEISPLKRFSTRWNRGRVILELFAATLPIPMLAACAQQPIPQTIPVEARPIQANNPIKVEAPIQMDNDTPEKRFKSWFKSVVTGNKEDYQKQFPANNNTQPLQTGLTDLYKSCDISQVKIIDSKERPDGIWDYVFDFQSNCIPGDRKAPSGSRYVAVREQKDKQGVFIMISVSVTSSPTINPMLN